MKKILIALLALIILTVSLAACTGNENEGADTSAAAGGEVTSAAPAGDDGPASGNNGENIDKPADTQVGDKEWTNLY